MKTLEDRINQLKSDAQDLTKIKEMISEFAKSEEKYRSISMPASFQSYVSEVRKWADVNGVLVESYYLAKRQ